MQSNNNSRNVGIFLLLLLLVFGSTISLISNTSKIYSIIIEDLKKKVFKQETVLSYIYSISIIGFCIIPSGVIFSKPNASRNVLLYGIIITLSGYVFLFITQKICIYYMNKYLISDLSSSIFFIFSYGISFALILQGGVTLNLGSLWINLLYWPIKYGGLITSIQFTMYSIGGLTLSEIYRLFFLDSGSILNFFLTCFCISAIIGFFSIYMIILIEKKIINSISNSDNSNKSITDFDDNSSNIIDLTDTLGDTFINNEYNSDDIKERISNKVIKYDRKGIISFIIKSDYIIENNSNINCQNKYEDTLVIDNIKQNITTKNKIDYIKDGVTLKNNFLYNKECELNEGVTNKNIINDIKGFKNSVYNFITLISNIEIVSLIFVYLFTISTGQFFGTFIQRFSLYYIPNITKEKSIRMIQILTIIELFVRILSGYISDLLDNGQILYKSTQTIILTLTMSLSLLLINYLKSNWILVIFGVGFSYAAMYSIAPSYIRSLFKQNEFALINSFCYSMVIPGNLILSIVLANTPQKYTTSLQIIGYLSLIPFALMTVYKIKTLYVKLVYKKNKSCVNNIIENNDTVDATVNSDMGYDIENIVENIEDNNVNYENTKKVMIGTDKIGIKKFILNSNKELKIYTISSSSTMSSSSIETNNNVSMSNIKN
ncbi:hypothetical protein FG386_000928 [Cryptosporidium ryanae]|uniref:uncharacterized protein n=1 Tax=Cryptosporidium ryanae TaxID=515981 RepID=UPI00351A0E8E|nr:hypothetical protein FG386_000928 [Cryptosporidium ryanae]